LKNFFAAANSSIYVAAVADPQTANGHHHISEQVYEIRNSFLTFLMALQGIKLSVVDEASLLTG